MKNCTKIKSNRSLKTNKDFKIVNVEIGSEAHINYPVIKTFLVVFTMRRVVFEKNRLCSEDKWTNGVLLRL